MVSLNPNPFVCAHLTSPTLEADPYSRLYNLDVAGHTTVPNLWRIAGKGGYPTTVRPGTVIGLSIIEVRLSDESEFTLPTSMVAPVPDDTKRGQSGIRAHVVVPSILSAGSWEPEQKVFAQVCANKKLHLVDGAVWNIRLGIVTWLGADSNVDKVADALYKPDVSHKLPRLRICLGA